MAGHIIAAHTYRVVTPYFRHCMSPAG